MKVIIAGSRIFDNYEELCQVCDRLLSNLNGIEIVSGTANGTDRLGEVYANDMNYPIKQFPANWDKHGKSAGYIRNEQMAKYADALIAFWDGKSKGTMNMINIAEQYDLKIRIHNIHQS